MGFTTPCFIRKNTEELRKKLEELGYKMLSPIEYDNLECSNGWVNDIKSPNDCNGIDCGTNKELFLALAALRDDTSANQHWVFDQDFPPHYKKGDFTIGYFSRCSYYCHVDTVNELIEHFKEKE